MKELFLLILLFSLISFRKDESKLNPDNIADKPLHCYNHEYNPLLGELSYDCGGPCDPCDFVTPACTTSVNTFENSDLYGNFTYFNIDTLRNFKPVLKIESGDINNFNISIIINDTINNLNKEYSTTDKINKSNANIKFDYDGKTYYGESGKMFINFINDSLRINLCNIELETNGGDKSEIDNANITFKP